MSFGITNEDGVAVIRVDGTFDADAAAKLRALVNEAAPGAPVIIDFTQARVISDIGLAALLEAVDGRAGRVRFRGLAHGRMVQFLPRL